MLIRSLLNLPIMALNFAPDDAEGSGGTSSVDGEGSTSTVEKETKTDIKGEEKKSFTQKELDFLFADRSNRARNEATSEILKALGVETVEKAKELIAKSEVTTEVLKLLGVDSIEKAKELIAKQIQADEASKSELQKAQEEAVQNKQLAEQIKAEVEAIKAAAREQLIRAEIVRHVIAYNNNNTTFRPEAVDDVWLLIDKASIKDDEKGGFTGIKEAVEQVAKDRPHWLHNARTQGLPHGTPNTSGKTAQPKQETTIANQPGKKPVTL